MARGKQANKAAATEKEPKAEVKKDEVVPEVPEGTPATAAEVRADEAHKAVKATKAEKKDAEEAISAKDAKIETVNAIFSDLERVMLHGSAEQMNQQQNELLTAKIKIKRLI